MNSGIDHSSQNIAVLIAVGVRLYREGLAGLLDQEAGILVQGTAADGVDAIAKAKAARPDVVLLDTRLPDGLAVVRALREAAPASRIVAIAVGEMDAEVIAYAEAGVSGYVAPDQTVQQLACAIRSAASGELFCSPRVAGVLLRQVAVAAVGICPSLDRLTLREKQIVGLLDQGCSNKEIAARLGIEVSTVKNHVHHVLGKLRATRRGEAAARARRAYQALEARQTLVPPA